MGVRRYATGLILPWVVINVVDTAGGLIIFILKVASKRAILSTSKTVAAVCYFVMTIYFIASVQAYYQSLRRQKRLARQILRSNSTLASGKIEFI